LDAIFKPRSNIFVKINHLSPASSPEKGIITHPAFTREILLLLKEAGHRLVVGDDIQAKEEDGFSISGYRQICQELSIPLYNLKEKGFRDVVCQGKVLKNSFISQLVLDADYILNIPKLKTHSFTIYTGAIKNMFGIIPYGLRLKYHREYIWNDIFSQMLVDIYGQTRPHLNIMDAVMAMEGEGPSAGTMKRVGAVLASRDAVALDAVATKIVGFDPREIFTTYHAHERGLGIGDIKYIQILGERLEDFRISNFKHSAFALGLFRNSLPSFLYAYFQEHLKLIPEVLRKKCTTCLECIDICPKEAIDLYKDIAWINESKCINCMCCHEVCRYQSINLKQSKVGKIIRLIYAFYHKVANVLS
jgi:uncharacterized protein (DUF362 family)/Pyruvate/2-oxoacid:ferredoxin oxidoreductase delta subunit